MKVSLILVALLCCCCLVSSNVGLVGKNVNDGTNKLNDLKNGLNDLRTYCLVSSRYGEPLQHEVLQFLEGFLVGVETQIGNITKCTEDVKISLADFESAARLFRSGFKNKSIKDIEQAFHMLGNGVQQLTVAFKDCNVPKLIKDLTKLVNDLKSGLPGIIKIVMKEVINIFHHGRELTNDIKLAIQFWEQRKFQLSGVQFGKIAAILLDY